MRSGEKGFDARTCCRAGRRLCLKSERATRRPALTAVSRLNSYAFQSAEIQALGLAGARNSPEEVLVLSAPGSDSLREHGSTQKDPHRVRFRTFLGDSVCIVFHRARPVDFFFIHLRFFRQFQPLRLNTFPRSCLGDHSFGWIVSKLRTESDGPCDRTK